MPRYAREDLDSPELIDGDNFFRRWVTRMHPSQLQPGDVAQSRNGRMDVDGSWQPRRGVDLISGTLTTTGALTLPFDLPTPAEIDDGVTAYLDPDAVQAIYGSCVWSNPNQESKEYIIIAANEAAFLIDPDDPETVVTIEYPAQVSLSSRVELLQAFDKVYVFRSGQRGLVWDGDLSGTPAFTLVQAGDYTQPSEETDATATTDNGYVEFTWTAHGLNEGTWVTLLDTDNDDLSEQIGQSFQVLVDDADTLRFRANVSFSSASVTLIKRLSVGGGFIHQPGLPWAYYHQARLWGPYNFRPHGSDDYTDRGIRDELVASDVFDAETWDPLFNQFRITAGIADYLVGVHGFTQDSLVVFNRNSIHLIQGISGRSSETRVSHSLPPQLNQLAGVSGSLNDTLVTQLTTEVGCLARKTIVSYKNEILFLSDNGVYSVQFADAYNLRGTGLPLSEPIADVIARINPQAANRAVACYHNNRYWLALPLDDSPLNNALLVYNFLNEAWESLDTFADPNFDIEDLHVSQAGAVNRLYIVNSQGGVHLVDGRPDDQDRLGSIPDAGVAHWPIASNMHTRQYTAGTVQRKKYLRAELHLRSSVSNSTDGALNFRVEDPDRSGPVTTVAAALGQPLPANESASLRTRLPNLPGHGIQLIFEANEGRPLVRATKVNAIITDRANRSVL